MWKIKKFVLDVLFPRFCLNCRKEGSWLCEDCFSLIEISDRQYCPFCDPYSGGPKAVPDGRTCPGCRKSRALSGLYAAAVYDSPLFKKIINQFKYDPYIKELSLTLASLIISHIAQLNKLAEFQNGFFAAIPLYKRKLRQRGFNQAEEIAKNISLETGGIFLKDVLAKTKPTKNQVELQKSQRKENIRGVFSCRKPDLISGKKIFLVDDVFTTGSTMEEAALALKRAGAKEIWGVVAARG